MNPVIKIVLFGLLCLLLTVMLRPVRPEYALLCAVFGAISVLAAAVDAAVPAVLRLSGLLNDAGISSDLLRLLLKAMGIGLLCEFGADTARDFGQSSLADQIVFAGKTFLFLLSFPTLEELLRLILSFGG